jgi:hypothetical protein
VEQPGEIAVEIEETPEEPADGENAAEERPTHQKVQTQEKSFLQKHGRLLALAVMEFTLVLVTVLVIVVVRK